MTERHENSGGGQSPQRDIPVSVDFPRRRDYSALMDLVKGVAVVWGMSILLNGVGVLFLRGGGTNGILFMVVATALIMLTSFSVSVYFVSIKHKKSIREGFSIRGMKFSHYIIYILGAMVLSLAMNSIEPETLQQDSLLYQILSTPEGKVAIAALIPFASIVEEFYYRGFIFPILLKYMSPALAVIIVSGWFSLAHAMEYGGNPFAIFAVFTLGLILTLERYLTKSLTPSLITHLAFNITTITMVFLLL